MTLAALPLLMAQPAMAQFNPFQLLTPQPAKPAPAKPATSAQQKKPAADSWHPAPAAAAAPKKPEAKTLEAKKPEAKTPDAKKPEAKKLETKKLETKKPEAKTAGAKKPASPKYALSDYYKVWDVTAETTRADIVKRFGEPRQPADPRVSYYFNETLVFYFNSDDTVRTMVVGNSFEAMPPDSIPREVLDKAFIGRSRDDVLKTFGPATDLSDNYRYLPTSGPYKVQFQCYDIERYVCRQMLVQF
ncbi:MAG TPA: hypothetical protein VFW22_15230 [Pseudolabrys sp.]|nr:hypothetical protein [Pseudolabrys sp.]